MKVLVGAFSGPCSDIAKGIEFMEKSLRMGKEVYMYGDFAHNDVLRFRLINSSKAHYF